MLGWEDGDERLKVNVFLAVRDSRSSIWGMVETQAELLSMLYVRWLLAEARHHLITPGQRAKQRWNSFFWIGQPGLPDHGFHRFQSWCWLNLEDSCTILEYWLRIMRRSWDFFTNVQQRWRWVGIVDLARLPDRIHPLKCRSALRLTRQQKKSLRRENYDSTPRNLVWAAMKETKKGHSES